ncbi:hypothetical protein [Fimbriiglobus ruber]|uniref:hypothetical protein n=1 Tax=Fimbriiglobus ruber TaxID=1908690 RepID=UPI00117BB722|nr:hypothetical protein [Fimbriiglobus ruber]
MTSLLEYEGATNLKETHNLQQGHFSDSLSQKNQIRDSFTSVKSATIYTAKSWTLCLPIDMSVEEAAWFSTFKKNQAECGIDIRPIWGASKFEELLMFEKNRHIRNNYFKEEDSRLIRQMAGHLQQILTDFIERIPVPKTTNLEIKALSMGMRALSVHPMRQNDYIAHLSIEFSAKNNGTKSAQTWNIHASIQDESQVIAKRLSEKCPCCKS